MSPSADSRYIAALAAACEARLAAGVRRFDELVLELGGADPAAALVTLDGVASASGPYRDAAAAIADQARSGEAPEGPLPLPLPLPHPLDYAWPFSVSARDQLLAALAAATKPGDRIDYIGAPTLHAAACAEMPDRRHLLVDRDNRHIEAAGRWSNAQVLRADLLTRHPHREPSAAISVVDPPWYPDEANHFVAFAAQGLRVGGTLLLSFARELTRPGAAEDLQQVVAEATRHGLEEIMRSPAALRYMTPPFEFAALRAAGVECVPPEWRVADLIEFCRTRSCSVPLRPSAPDGWTAADIGEVPFRVRADGPPTGRSLIGSLVPGDVLPSVSRRSPVRREVSLWTARNRVFASSDPARLAAVAAAVAGGGSVPSDRDSQRAARKLVSLAERERSECGLVSGQLVQAV